MWSLRNEENGEFINIYIRNKKYVVGRMVGDLILVGDTSISRQHAIVEIVDNKLYFSDCKSKYGTFLNNGIFDKKKVKPDERILLILGDRIRFGALKNIWVVEKMKVVSLLSALTEAEKTEVTNDLTVIGGCSVNEYTKDCTHLTMSNLSVTLKVLYSLVAGIPIVTPVYWKEVIKSMDLSLETKMPDYTAFSPSVQESFLRIGGKMFSTIDDKRKTLFAGKTFVFITERHMLRYEKLIVLAGGNTIHLGNEITKAQLIRPNTIVIKYTSSGLSQTGDTLTQRRNHQEEVYEYLTKHSKRAVPDVEIGYAILFSSTQKYCNPSVNMVTVENVDVTNLKIKSSVILARDTPIETQSVAPKKTSPCVIPDSDVGGSFSNRISDEFQAPAPIITIDDDDDDIDFSEPLPSEMNESIKRKSDEDICDQNAKKLHLDDGMESVLSPMDDITPEKQPIEPPKRVVTPPLAPVPTRIERPKSPMEMPGAASSSRLGTIQRTSHRAKRNMAQMNEDGDDLFNFKPIQTKKSKRSVDEEENGQSTESSGIFEFKRPTCMVTIPTQGSQPVQTRKSNRRVNNDNNNEDELLSGIVTPIQPQSKLPPMRGLKPLPIPKEGWLSASFNKLLIKSESKDDSKLDEKPTEKTLWIESIKNCFQVKTKNYPMKLNDSNVDEIDKPLSMLKSVCQPSNRTQDGCKNFKGFIKRNNVKKQSIVISVRPMPIQ